MNILLVPILSSEGFHVAIDRMVLVLDAKHKQVELKASRLSLCTVSAATIRLLMNLLGIPVVEKL